MFWKNKTFEFEFFFEELSSANRCVFPLSQHAPTYNERFCFLEIPRSRQQRKERQATDATPDHSYDFAFKTPEYQRRESSDDLGRVRGKFYWNLFIFIFWVIDINN